MPRTYSTLDKVDQVVACTRDAVLIRFTDAKDDTWIPRSVCEDGHDLAIGDKDVVVADWFIEKEGLD